MSPDNLKLPPKVDAGGLEIYVIVLASGKTIARTKDEIAHAPDEVRIAAGLPPRQALG